MATHRVNGNFWHLRGPWPAWPPYAAAHNVQCPEAGRNINIWIAMNTTI